MLELHFIRNLLELMKRKLMKGASEKLKPYLNQINWKEPKFPIISNVTSNIVKFNFPFNLLDESRRNPEVIGR
jgi:hypothetical protein